MSPQRVVRPVRLGTRLTRDEAYNFEVKAIEHGLKPAALLRKLILDFSSGEIRYAIQQQSETSHVRD